MKQRFEPKFATNKNKKQKLNLAIKNEDSANNQDQPKKEPNITNLPSEITKLIIVLISDTEKIALSCVNKQLHDIVEQYMSDINRRLTWIFNNEKPPFNITRSEKMFFFYIHKGLERDCEDIIKSALMLKDLNDAATQITVLMRMHTYMRYTYNGKYKVIGVVDCLLRKYYEVLVNKNIFSVVVQLLCVGRDPEGVKPLFDDQHQKKQDYNLLGTSLELLLEKLLSTPDQEASQALKIFNLIEYIFELGVDSAGFNGLSNNEDSNVVYFWQNICEEDNSDVIGDLCLKTIALMCADSTINNEELCLFWKDENDQPASGSLIVNPAYQNRLKIEEYIVNFKSRSTPRLG